MFNTLSYWWSDKDADQFHNVDFIKVNEKGQTKNYGVPNKELVESPGDADQFRYVDFIKVNEKGQK